MGQFNVPEGEFIFKVGEQAEVMYFIEKGGVEIGTGTGKPIAKLVAGDCFGEAALIKERARNFSARAVRPTRLVLIERGRKKRIGAGACNGEISGDFTSKTTRSHEQVKSYTDRQLDSRERKGVLKSIRSLL